MEKQSQALQSCARLEHPPNSWEICFVVLIRYDYRLSTFYIYSKTRNRTRILTTGCGEVKHPRFLQRRHCLSLTVVNRWLSVRFNLLSAGIVGATGLVCLITPSITASMAGFALAFASTITGDLLFMVRATWSAQCCCWMWNYLGAKICRTWAVHGKPDFFCLSYIWNQHSIRSPWSASKNTLTSKESRQSMSNRDRPLHGLPRVQSNAKISWFVTL